jgi:hypothetical protein
MELSQLNDQSGRVGLQLCFQTVNIQSLFYERVRFDRNGEEIAKLGKLLPLPAYLPP